MESYILMTWGLQRKLIIREATVKMRRRRHCFGLHCSACLAASLILADCGGFSVEAQQCLSREGTGSQRGLPPLPSRAKQASLALQIASQNGWHSPAYYPATLIAFGKEVPPRLEDRSSCSSQCCRPIHLFFDNPVEFLISVIWNAVI